MKNISLSKYSNKIKYLVGDGEINLFTRSPYDEISCSFIDELSRKLRKDKSCQQYPDIMAFAFWCRDKNLERHRLLFEDEFCRKGRGLIFHISPSNVPINFAFTFIFGVLAGNGNIVRVPSKHFPQIDMVCKKIEETLLDDRFISIKRQTAIISCERDIEIIDYLSSVCDIRVIWGGDSSISEIRKSPISPKAFDVTFADRYSIGIINSKKYLEGSADETRRCIEGFYNDTYLMDQNACSTPHLIFWEGNKDDNERAKKEFWKAVASIATKYSLEDMKVSEKYTMLCNYMIDLDEIDSINKYDNFLYVVHMNKLPEDITVLRGKYGMFFDYDIEAIHQIGAYISPKFQTLAYYGIDKCRLEDFIFEYSIDGIDRIVPFGKTLDIGVYWDGYDLISKYSRIITIE